MKLFVGLGNPGAKYAKHRHNVGFMALDEIAANGGFDTWRKKFQGRVCEGRYGSEKVVLLKPETFMNLSGNSVGEAVHFFKIDPEDIIAFHDEIDLAPGKCKVKTGGGHAGHNGLRSLHQHVGPDYVRVRIGVGHPGQKNRVPGYVLHDFSKADQSWLAPLLNGMGQHASFLAAGDHAGFLNALALGKSEQKREAGQKLPAKLHKPVPKQDVEPEDTRTLLQRLADKFS